MRKKNKQNTKTLLNSKKIKKIEEAKQKPENLQRRLGKMSKNTKESVMEKMK